MLPLTEALPRVDSREIALLTPTGRDGAMLERVLTGVKLETAAYHDMRSLCDAVGEGVGVVIIAEEALNETSSAILLDTLAAQPPWSDLPLVVLAGEGELSHAIPRTIEGLTTRANVTLIERPVRVATLVSVLRSALRARERQYDVRGHLEERRRLLANEQEARRQAELAAEEATDANQAKSEFLAVMSHELRTPLNAIGGYAELMELGIRGPLTAEQRDDLARIRKSQRHLLGLINGVLNFSRIEAGAIEYDVGDTVASEVLATCEALIAPQLRAKGLTFVFEGCDPELTVRADAEKLQQILLNLLTNAVKFTDRGGRIEFECKALDDVVRFCVRDTGRGINSDQLVRVFEPFVQIDARLTRTQEGLGLGLAISRDLARGMGGDLTVDSRRGVGSEFTLTLPRWAA